jgi:hypothetical protein
MRIEPRFNHVINIDEDGITLLAALDAGFGIVQGLRQSRSANPNFENVGPVFVALVYYFRHGFQRRHVLITSELQFNLRNRQLTAGFRSHFPDLDTLRGLQTSDAQLI